MRNKKWVFALPLLLSTAACGKSFSETMRGIGEAVKSADIQRDWAQSTCSQSGAFKIVGASKRTTYGFATNDLKKTDQYYSDSQCSHPTVAVTYSGQFEKKDLVIQPDVYAIDMNLTQAVVTPQNAEGVKLLNDTSFCGKKVWAVDVSADLTDRTRDLFCPLKNLPEVSHNVYAVRNGALLLGKGEPQSKAENRPVELDLEMPYGQGK